MSAITVRLEQSAAQEEQAAQTSGLQGAKAKKAAVIPPLDQSHGEITNMAWLRSATLDALKTRKVSVQTSGRDVWLYLDKPLKADESPAWNPISLAEVKRGKLLSWTSKMGTPSFSLPAGAPAMGGSCVGASGGQTIVPPNVYNAQKKVVLNVLGTKNYEASDTICQNCYAEGGQYATGNVQVYQLMRMAWAQAAVADGSFVETMNWAIRNANFRLDGKGMSDAKDDNDQYIIDAITNERIKLANRGERDHKRYFRIHDSGDFFSPEYFAAWKAVADSNPDITFWAPSRVWASDKFRKAVAEINAEPRNFIIRPSSYSVDGPAPDLSNLGAGWAAGSTVFREEAKAGQNAYNWDCKAYVTDSQKVTCRDAKAPGDNVNDPKQVGCRACWKLPETIVNYTFH